MDGPGPCPAGPATLLPAVLQANAALLPICELPAPACSPSLMPCLCRFHVRELTPQRLMEGLEEGLSRLDELTRNAEEMAMALHQEDGVGTAVAVIEAAALAV